MIWSLSVTELELREGSLFFCSDMTRDLDLNCNRLARYSSFTGKVIQTEVVVVVVSMVVMLQRNTVGVYRSRVLAPVTSGSVLIYWIMSSALSTLP